MPYNGYQGYQNNPYNMPPYGNYGPYNGRPPFNGPPPVNYMNNNIQGGYYGAPINQQNGGPPLKNIQVCIYYLLSSEIMNFSTVNP